MKITDGRGVALITALFFLVIITILAVGTLIVATTQINVAGSMARWEASFDASEGGADFVIPLIKSLYYDRIIPSIYQPYVKDSNLIEELTNPDLIYSPDTFYPLADDGYPRAQNPAVAGDGPDVVLWLGNEQVEVDIDGMGLVIPPMGGGSDRMQIGYYAQGRSQKLNMFTGYRIEVRAATPKTRVETIQTIGIPVR